MRSYYQLVKYSSLVSGLGPPANLFGVSFAHEGLVVKLAIINTMEENTSC